MAELSPATLTERAGVLHLGEVLSRRLERLDAAYRSGGEAAIRAVDEFRVIQPHVDKAWHDLGDHVGDRAEDILRARIAVSAAELLARRMPGLDQIERLTTALEAVRRHAVPAMEAKLLLRLANACYNTSGPRPELYEQALEIARDLDDPDLLYDALFGRALCANAQRDLESARAHYEQALAVADRTGMPFARPRALTALGNLLREQGDLAGAERRLREGIAIMERGGVPMMVQADAYRYMGLLRMRENRPDDAAAWFERQRQIGESIGDRRAMSSAINSLGWVAYSRNDLESAAQSFEQAADLATQTGNIRLLAQAEGNLGAVLLEQGKPHEAMAHHERALALFRRFGDPRGTAEELVNGAAIRHALGDIPQAVSALRQALLIEGAGPVVTEEATRLLRELESPPAS